MFSTTRKCLQRYATPEGTLEYLTKAHPNPILLSYQNKIATPQHHQFNSHHGLHLSPIGFGSYRVGIEQRSHQFALQVAIQSGVNVIDTSTNYENGDSEMMIGTVLQGMILEDVIKREHVVVKSKIGYIQGDNMDLCLEREAQGKPFSDIVKVHDPWHWHCISPDFLEAQLTLSLERLQLQTLDVLYLHNPEYVWTEEDDSNSFYTKIRRAFEHLEQEVERGRIQYYGISSNTFPNDPNQIGNVSLAKCYEIAEQVAGKDHHFKFVQFPFNIEECNAALLKNCNGQTLIDFAKSKNLTTAGNRPLNAAIDGNIYRYSDSLTRPINEEESQRVVSEWSQLINQTIYEEINAPFDRNTFSDSKSGSADKDMPHKAGLSWGQILAANLDQLSSLYAFRETMQNRIRPEVSHALQKLRRHPNIEQYSAWATQYNYLFNTMLTAYDKFLADKHQREANEVKQQMDAICPELSTSSTLAQKTVRVLSSTDIDTVLVGMRTTDYVKDITQMGPRIPGEKALDILQSVQWKPIHLDYETTQAQQQ